MGGLANSEAVPRENSKLCVLTPKFDPQLWGLFYYTLLFNRAGYSLYFFDGSDSV